MADQKISDLPTLASISAGDFFVVVEDQGGGAYETKKYDLGPVADAVAKKHDQSHALGSADHTAATLSELNAKISDATLIDTGDSRLHTRSHSITGADDHASMTADRIVGRVTSAGTPQELTAAQVKTLCGIGTMAERAMTISTSQPSGGSDGDVWFVVEA